MHGIKIQTEWEMGSSGETSEDQASPLAFQSQWVFTNLGRKVHEITKAP